jgi:hypothetical protein
MRPTRIVVMSLALIAVAGARDAAAEPKYLSKQYTRCTTCHVSPTGGGLLSAYGRSLSHRELSTTGAAAPAAGEPEPQPGEEAFLWNALRDALGPVQLGVNLRPSHLRYDFAGFNSDRNLLMTADVQAAVRVNDWVFFGQVGRELDEGEFTLDSSEYWGGRQPEEGTGFRAGRFLPAYGVRFADHTSYNRVYLGLAQYDQILGAEVSYARGRYLTQVAAGARAEPLFNDDGREAFMATGRVQADLGSRATLVGSGLFRAESDIEPTSGAAGIALGYAPAPRLATWTQLDGLFSDGQTSTAYVLTNETSFEVYRGIWAVVTPQARVGGGSAVPDVLRFGAGAVFLPRTHFNVNVHYYRDRNKTSEITTQILLLQLHMYL